MASAGAKSVSFTVTVGTGACTGAVPVTATLANGNYNNVWSGPMSVAGSFAYLAGSGLPTDYAAGFWVGPKVASDSAGDFVVPTLKTYADGRFSMGGPGYHNNSGWDYGQDSAYSICGHIASSGAICMDSDDPESWCPVFSINGSSFSKEPSVLYDGSTLTFSSDGKSATLTVIAQQYTWTLSANPTIVWGDTVTLGTYVFTRVK
jgi:hypothetical protein